MANLTRLDPFSDSFEETFRRIFGSARWEREAAPMDIKVDAEESEKAHTTRAEIPGAKREDINARVRPPRERSRSAEGERP